MITAFFIYVLKIPKRIINLLIAIAKKIKDMLVLLFNPNYKNINKKKQNRPKATQARK